MLEANKGAIVPRVEPVRFALNEPPTPDALSSALASVRRQIWIVVLTAALGAILGTIFVAYVVPNYNAFATLLIDTRKVTVSQQPAVFAQMSLESASAMDSQLEILKSEGIVLAVIDKLRLVNDPEFVNTRRGVAATLLGGFLSPPWVPTDAERVALARDFLTRHLTVNRIGISYAIEIGFESKSAVRAAEVANAVADAYIEQQLSSQYNGTRQASDWLKSRVDELRGPTEAAQTAVVEYKKRNNIVETPTGQLADDASLTELKNQLGVVHGQVNQAKAILDQLETVTQPNALSGIMNASIGNTADSETVSKLRSKYLELTYREAELSAKYGRDHLAVVGLRNQMAQVRSEMLEEFKHAIELRRGEFAIAQQREAELGKELHAVLLQSQVADQAQVELRQLEASARSAQDSYNSLLNRYQASVQEQTSPVAEASVITKAIPPGARNYKKTLVVAILFPLMGLGVGVGIALLRDLSSRAFWTSRTIESSLRLACIGILPKVKYSKKKQSPAIEAPFEGRSVVRGDNGVSWTVVDDTFSRFSEGVRSIKLAVDMDNKSRSNRVIGFTSTIPNEGKSTVALAFGQLVARSGARVIVVDCDLRNPSLTRSIAPHATAGILETISGGASLEEVVWTDRSTHMDFLPAVLKSKYADSYSILDSDGMRSIFDELRAKYEFVVVDLSPLAPVVDVGATASLVDSYVLIIEWGRTKTDIVEHALRSAPAVYESIIGAVLNKADIKQLASRDTRLAGYYYNKDYRRYGYSDA